MRKQRMWCRRKTRGSEKMKKILKDRPADYFGDLDYPKTPFLTPAILGMCELKMLPAVSVNNVAATSHHNYELR